jgi:hypothetical protein
MAALKACHLARLPLQEIPLHAFGELDISVKSSKEELATARGEIAELKALVRSLCVATHLQFKRSAPAGFYQNYDPRTDAVDAHLNALSKPAEGIWQAAQDEANAAARAMLKK